MITNHVDVWIVADGSKDPSDSVFITTCVETPNLVYLSILPHNGYQTFSQQTNRMDCSPSSSADSKVRDTLPSRHMRGDLTLNSMALIHTSVIPLTSRDLTCQHASHISVVAHISWDVTYVLRADTVTSCFQKCRKCLSKKCANGPFYTTPNHQIIEIST
jgi:hypothetical protein